ncbi:g12298 [Coccomyxa viridis]|uniref:G12298 protein n=1 Tax=Coccomyxa viridis TaxID=1274662 RepID=A0ABP1GA10_9CHLO
MLTNVALRKVVQGPSEVQRFNKNLKLAKERPTAASILAVTLAQRCKADIIALVGVRSGSKADTLDRYEFSKGEQGAVIFMQDVTAGIQKQQRAKGLWHFTVSPSMGPNTSEHMAFAWNTVRLQSRMPAAAKRGRVMSLPAFEPWQKVAGARVVDQGGSAKALSLSLESMASRSLLHDIGVQQPKVIQFAAWQAAGNETRTGSSLQRLWLSPHFADPAAQFGLLAVSNGAHPGEEWETVKRSLSESRELYVEDILSAATFGSRGRTGRSGQDREHNSTVDSIIHFRPMKQLQSGGLLSTRSPDWLTSFGASVSAWLQHWLRPRHLKERVLDVAEMIRKHSSYQRAVLPWLQATQPSEGWAPKALSVGGTASQQIAERAARALSDHRVLKLSIPTL